MGKQPHALLENLQAIHTSARNTWDDWSPELRDEVQRHVHAAYAAIIRSVVRDFAAPTPEGEREHG